MNAAFDPWIPGTCSGVSGLFSLRDMLQPGAVLGGTPTEFISVHRLLQAILLDACRWENEDSLLDMGADGARAQALAYLNTNRERFEDFLQVKELPSGTKYGLHLLDVHATSGGNSGRVTEHQFPKIQTEADRLLSLLVYLNFAINSKGKVDNSLTMMSNEEAKRSYLTANGINHRNKDGSCDLTFAGPCLQREPGVRHHFLLGNDALASALLSVPTAAEGEIGVAPWMVSPVEDLPGLQRDKLLSRLIPMTRFVRIEEDGFYTTTGVALRGVPVDSAITVTIPAKGANEAYDKTFQTADQSQLWALIPESVLSLRKEQIDLCPNVRRAMSRGPDLGVSSYKWWVGGAISKSSSGEVFWVPGYCSMELEVSDPTPFCNRVEEVSKVLSHFIDKASFRCKLYFKELGVLADSGLKEKLFADLSGLAASAYAGGDVASTKDQARKIVLEAFFTACRPSNPKTLRVYAKHLGYLKEDLK